MSLDGLIGLRSSVTLLVAASGSGTRPPDSFGTAARTELCLFVSAVYASINYCANTSLETALEWRHQDLSVRCVLGAQQTAAPHPSSAMSPAGYSLALLSSTRRRFAGRFPSWSSSCLASIEKCSKGDVSAGRVKPALAPLDRRPPLVLTFWPAKMRSF